MEESFLDLGQCIFIVYYLDIFHVFASLHLRIYISNFGINYIEIWETYCMRTTKCELHDHKFFIFLKRVP